MNIFTVLSQGKGRLNEENLSAMLGFLLTPTQTHGLGDIFLRHFLFVVAQTCGDLQRFSDILEKNKPLHANVVLENAYNVDSKRRVIDIEIQINIRPNSNNGDVIEVHRLAIENKVKTQAADTEQFKEEFEGILQDLDGDNRVKITMVFLTPPGENSKFSSEYDNLGQQLLNPHRKAWLRWSGDATDSTHIVALIKMLLQREEAAEIAPMSEYLRHTLKAFVRHIIESSAGNTSKAGTLRTLANLSDNGVVQLVIVESAGTKYQIQRLESSTILVFNLDTQEYEVAKPFLRKINQEKSLGVDLNRPSGGGEKNTRALGRQIINALIAKGIVVEQ